MRSHSPVEKAINTLARDRIVDCLHDQRRSGRSVVTLVDISEETAVDPETVEAVMTQLERAADVPVRRATADQPRWHIRR